MNFWVIQVLNGVSLGILLIEQCLHFVPEHADTVLMMNKGALVSRSSPEELRKDQEVQRKYLGI